MLACGSDHVLSHDARGKTLRHLVVYKFNTYTGLVYLNKVTVDIDGNG